MIYVASNYHIPNGSNSWTRPDCRHQAATGAERVREKPTVARFATSIQSDPPSDRCQFLWKNIMAKTKEETGT